MRKNPPRETETFSGQMWKESHIVCGERGVEAYNYVTGERRKFKSVLQAQRWLDRAGVRK